MTSFDPNAAADPDAGIFGLPHGPDDAHIHLLPVPFDATTSYGGGASAGPEAIRSASMQVDLHDHQHGPVYQRGIYMEPPDEDMLSASRQARALAAGIIERGGCRPGSGEDREAVTRVDAACERVNGHVESWTRAVLQRGCVPGIIGGDHSTPFGAIKACAEHAAASGDGFGILQVDAHMDLREAYEDFTWSHASIMWNVLERVPEVTRLVQVGIRDYCEAETKCARRWRERVNVQYDYDWWRWMDDGASFRLLCERAVADLPGQVFISFDINGLSPELCPGTGTPVPGGLSFNQAAALLEILQGSGRRVIGFDLNEVCPHEGDGEFNANVGARLLYKLCGICA
ncbi:MAG: agmatinase family protein [Phycisphaerales bacterium]|nr:agmatinase family protein [Phycisphaerales bacterium]